MILLDPLANPRIVVLIQERHVVGLHRMIEVHVGQPFVQIGGCYV